MSTCFLSIILACKLLCLTHLFRTIRKHIVYLFSNGIQGGCCFIKNKNRGIFEDGSCYSNTLLLPTRQLQTPLPNLKMEGAKSMAQILLWSLYIFMHI